MSDMDMYSAGTYEVLRLPEEQQASHLLSPEETPAAGDTARLADSTQLGQLCHMEPSLHIDADHPVPQIENTEPIPPGDDIDFPSARDSPEIPGASSVMLHQWDMRDSAPPSPRSERSSQSSFYPPGSSRTSNTGIASVPEPRSLVRSREPKADLSTGDVVMLIHQGRPYVAVQARLPYKENASHTCLEPSEEGVPLESEALSYLEVVKQGPFVGFRSGAAGNRFMQPRRKAPHRLVFFNHNCGVWEQWDVIAEDWRTVPWSTLHMVLRNRHLPQVQIAVEVVRVGYFTSPGPPGPRSLLPMIPEDPLLEDRNLRRISNLLITEWFKFVDHEKLLREGLEADLAVMADETRELKIKTIQQVEYLRMQINEEMTSLFNHVTLRDEAIATLRGWLQRAQQLAANRMARQRHRRILVAWRYVVDDIVFRKAAILKLCRKRENALREVAFRAWSQHTRTVIGAAVKLKFAVQRRSHAIMLHVLQGWQLAVARRGWRERTMLTAVQRRSMRRLNTAFAAWRRLTAQRALGRRALLRALHGVNLHWLAAALTAWRAAAQAVHQKMVQADLLLARRATRMQAMALEAWRDQVLRGRVADRHARAALARRVVVGWRHTTGVARAAFAAAEAMAAARPAARRRDVLTSWHVTTAAAASLRARLNRHVMSRVAVLQGRALAAWALAARVRRRRRVVLQRHLTALRLRTAAAVFAGWRAMTTRTSWRRVRVVAALGRASTRRLTSALISWHAYAAHHRAIVGRTALAIARLRRMRLAACLGSWHQLATRLQVARTNLLALCRRLLTYTLSSAFREWRQLTTSAGAVRSAVARALPGSTRDLLREVLATWWISHCAISPVVLDGLGAALRSAAADGRGPGFAGATTSPGGITTGYAAAAAAVNAAGRPVSAGMTPRQSAGQLHDTAVRMTTSLPSNIGIELSAAVMGEHPHHYHHQHQQSAQPSGYSVEPADSSVDPTSVVAHSAVTAVNTPISVHEARLPGSPVTFAPTAAWPAPFGSSPTRGSNNGSSSMAGTPTVQHRSSYSNIGGGTAGPFVPANAAVIGQGSSPVLVEMGPGHGGEGPLTPVGLPELLDSAVSLTPEGSMPIGLDILSPVGNGVVDIELTEALTATTARPLSHPLPPETLQEVYSVLLQTQTYSGAATPAAARILGFAEDADLQWQQQVRSLGAAG
ncbi:hypothetical protein Vretimale_16342, partial [Volvox reticuliferus]